MLFVLNNLLTYEPVTFNHSDINGLIGSLLTIDQDAPNPFV